MKHALSLVAVAFLALRIAALGDSVATDPVGFTTLTASNKSTSAGQLNFVSLNLTRPAVFQGSVPAGGSNGGSGQSVLTFSGTPFTGLILPAYVEIANGSGAGVVSDIVSFTSSTLTLADNASAVIDNAGGTTSIKVRPHWTFSTAFGTPSGSDATAIQGGTSLAAADVISILDPGNPVVSDRVRDYFYNTNSPAHWTRSDGSDATNVPIPLTTGLQILRRSSTALSMKLVGAVKLGATAFDIEAGGETDTTTMVSNPYPLTSKRLDQLGLYINGNPSTGLVGAPPTATLPPPTADYVRILDPQTGVINDFFFDTSTGSYGNRWKTGFTDASLYTIPEGASIAVVRRASRPAFTWYAPQAAMNLDPNAAPTQIQLLSAVSRKAHPGAALTGAFNGDINLPLTSTSADIGIESRGLGGASNSHTVILTFSDNVTGGTVTSSVGSASTTTSGTQMTVNLTNIPDAATVTLSLANITGAQSLPLASQSFSFGTLAGDVNSSRTVNAADIAQVKAQASIVAPVALGNFRADVGLGSTSSAVNATDIAITKAQSTKSL